MIKIDDLNKVWLAALESTSENLQGSLDDIELDRGKVWQRDAERTRDPKIGLGTALRLIILKRVLDLRAPKEAPALVTLKARNEALGRPLPSTDFHKLFQIGDATSPAKNSFDVAACLFAEYLDELFPGAASRIPSEVFGREFNGKDAIAAYARWAMFGRDVIMNQGFDAPFELEGNRERRLNELTEAIFDNTPTAPMFVSVFQKSMWNGLSAAVLEALRHERDADDDRPILYIPLMSRGEEYRAPSFPQILGFLRTFFKRGDVENAPPVSSDEDVHAILADIRNKMAEQPAIMVFDGYADTPLTCGELERAIIDDHMVSLLRRLLSPPITDLDKPGLLENFSRSRIVLVSDVDMTPVIPGTYVDIPLPAPGSMPKIIELQNIPNEKLVVRAVKRVLALQSDRSEAVIHSLDALFSTHRELDPEASADNLVTRVCAAVADVGQRNAQPTQTRNMSAVVEPLLALMRKRRPDWLWILRLVASTPGGLRLDTFYRLVRASSRITDANGKRVDVLPVKDAEKTIRDLLRVCRSILTDRMTDEFEGLTKAHSAEFIDGNPFRYPLEDKRGMPTIDFRTPEVRLSVLNEIRAKDFRQVQHLHLLLAEEAIAQQTIAFRHDPNLTSSRSLRRLMSVIYHGYMSLPMGDTGTIGPADIRGADFTIPADPQAAWRWIFLFVFRRVIEQPPGWQLSRYYGLDALKLQILRVTARPWLTWERYPRITKLDETGRTLISSPPSSANETASPIGERERKIAIDFHLSMAQVEYALGNITESEKSLERAEAYETGERSRLRVAKRRLDLFLLEQRFDEAIDEEKHAWELLGPAAHAIDAYISQIAERMKGLVSAENFKPSPILPSSEQTITALKQVVATWGQDGLAQISDVLFRVGERYAVAGDHNYTSQRVREIEQGIRRRDIAAYSDAIADFCRSMAYFRLAEKIRLAVFSDDPIGIHFFASGHSARQMTRVALKLENLARIAAGKRFEVGGYFARSARQMADVMTRHLYRYPRERASMLIMEATMARQGDPSEIGLDGLRSARLFLQDAEPLISSLSSRTRVRMRFLLERIKIHRRLGERVADAKSKQMYFAFCDLDLNALDAMVEMQPTKLWGNLLRIQRDSVSRARQSTGGNSQDIETPGRLVR